jgi:Beta-ketoacyl synthase, N-terminal domain
MTLSVYLTGLGFLGPGLNNWSEAAAVLSQRRSYAAQPTVLPSPTLLPAAERRRTGRGVKLALAVALQATAQARVDPKELPSVFSSSSGDGQICHELCQALAEPAREVSPTKFSNSVHNAAAGYWGIATGAMSAANALCAFDASFGAGLLDALTQCCVEQRDVLLVSFDTEYPQPLYAKRPVPDALGVAMVLTPQRLPHSLARLEASLTDEPFAPMAEPLLEVMRAAIPAARALPLLELLARGRGGRVVLEYLSGVQLAVGVEACA